MPQCKPEGRFSLCWLREGLLSVTMFWFLPPPLSLFGIKIKVNTKFFSVGYNIKNGYYCTISSNVIQLPSKCHPTVFKNGYYCIFGNISLLHCIFGNNSLLHCVFGNISLLHCIFSNQWMMKKNKLMCSMTLWPKTFLTLEAWRTALF